MPPRKLENMSPEQIEENVGKLSPAWAQEYIRRLEGLTRALHTQLQAAQSQGSADLHLAREISGARDRLAEAQPSVWTPAGITPPDGEYSTVRVVDGTANMEPVADIDQKFEIRFADFYQVRYGDHETTGDMRLLVIEADSPVQIRPISQTTVLIARGTTE